jgi:hypothetical protein
VSLARPGRRVEDSEWETYTPGLELERAKLLSVRLCRVAKIVDQHVALCCRDRHHRSDHVHGCAGFEN